MSSEILHSVLTRLIALAGEALQQDFEGIPLRLSGLHLSETWSQSPNTVFVVPHGVTLFEQGIRSEVTRQKVADPAGGDELYRFYRAPMPITLHFLFVPNTDHIETDLKVLGRLYQLLHEQPVLNEEQNEGDGGGETRQTLSADTRMTPELLTALFQASRISPRLSIPCLIRCQLRSDRVMREARPSRSVRGTVHRT